MNWVQCDHCEEWYHLLCVGLGTDEVKEDEDYKCFKCSDKNGTTIIPSMSDIIIKQESQEDLVCHESMPDELSESVFSQSLSQAKSVMEQNIVEDSQEIAEESEMACDINSEETTKENVSNDLEELVPQDGNNSVECDDAGTAVVAEESIDNLDTHDDAISFIHDESSMESQDDSQNSEEVVEEPKTVVEPIETPLVMPDIEESSCSQDVPSVSSVENNTDETS